MADAGVRDAASHEKNEHSSSIGEVDGRRQGEYFGNANAAHGEVLVATLIRPEAKTALTRFEFRGSVCR